ncbi:MAG: DUF3192 domain-containing protein [Thermodesulfobacteriota bacterium]
MKTIRLILKALASAMLLTGCMFYWNEDTKTLKWEPQYEPLTYEMEDLTNQYHLQRLVTGMSRDEVYEVMGMPDIYGMYENVNRDYVAVFYYYTGTRVNEGAAAREECTPVVLRNGVLIGWGNDFLKGLKEYPLIK